MEWSLLADLQDADRRALLAQTRRHHFAKDEVVFHEGDPADALHLVEQGRFAVRITTPLGDRATLSVVGSGGLFGELSVVSDACRNATVAALEPAQTLSLRREQVDELRQRHPGVDQALIRALAEQLRQTSTRLVEALYVGAEKRVLRRLLDVADLYQPAEGAVVIPLTQEEIAQLAGTTRPTVNRVLRSAEADGILSLRRGHIELLERDRLAQASH